MTQPLLRIGTRRSRLALAQSRPVRVVVMYGPDLVVEWQPGDPWKLPLLKEVLDEARRLPGAPRLRLYGDKSLTELRMETRGRA